MLRLPPPIWTMAYLTLAAGVSWALNWPQLPWASLHEPAGVVVFFAGGVLIISAFRLFRLSGTDLDPLAEQSRVLITDGPYRVSRNPMYLGLVVVSLGAAVWVGAWPMLAVPIAVFLTANFAHIPFEEAKLRRQFGETYAAYAARVRRWL